MIELGNGPWDKNYKPSGTTKAQEAALKAFPGQPFIHDRCVFRMGYEQATKDTIERAIAWLKENANKYIVDIGVGYGEHGRNVELVVGGMCWEHLKDYLQNE